jgi:hypothetical protein
MRKLTKPLRLARGLKSVFAATAIASAEGRKRITVSRTRLLGERSGRAGAVAEKFGRLHKPRVILGITYRGRPERGARSGLRSSGIGRRAGGGSRGAVGNFARMPRSTRIRGDNR